MKRKNQINEQFSVRLISMLESPAYQVLSLSAHKVISRIDIELAHHGGNDNGKLPVTYQDFIDYGITRECISPAIREAVALGFIKITRHGRGGNADYREATLYLLTFAYARGGKQTPPSHDWRKIKTLEEAKQIAVAARANKSASAIARGRWANSKRSRNRCAKPASVPVRKTHTETAKFSVRKTRTTGSVRKPVLLSISRGGGRGEGLVQSKSTLPSQDTQDVGDSGDAA
jgi:hypothetical protein